MEWLQQQLQTYLPLISENNLIQASLIFLFAAIASKIARAIIERIHVHAAGRTANPLDDHLFAILQRPVGVSILLIGTYLALLKSQLIVDQMPLVESVLVTIAVFYWLRCVLDGARFSLRLLSGDESRLKVVQSHTLPLFENVAVIIIYGAAIYFIFVAWDIDVSAWIASAGILGLALSFAAKDTLANLFAGVFILADTPYKIGDFIVLDSGERGKVTHIGIRSTRILTRNDVEVTIPNAIMGNTKIINETAGPSSKYRIRVQIGVAYGSDIPKVRAALLKAASSIETVEADPAARVRFRTFGDSSLNFELLCWVAEPVLRGQVSDLLNEEVYNEFNRQGIEIPFPQRDVNLRQIPPKE
ncbi:mechanosensitive ion channel family protein [Aliikangiella marina]|uniref:Small-conductance mechanosensitive channel n=1 Tax=Aliikangiella marina TaxID=1712262 RepID=A0A545TCB3_9GAMM|nr:mechanosensitive ion channel family protein [Aliikangiella marina]TQV74826.1 mechanosensitive ion channel family protein [Aliikangiella marina]